MMCVDVVKTPLCRVLPSAATFTRRPSRCGLAHAAFLCVVVLLNVLLPVVGQEQSSSLYPFGRSAGDDETEKSDDGGSQQITLDQDFLFFAKRRETLYVNNNGVISFGVSERDFRPGEFPLTKLTPMVAVYWADVDIHKGNGTVWYRQTQDREVLRRADRDVRSYSSEFANFQATWAFITTWEEVSFYGAVGQGTRRYNTFQCVLVSNGNLSFVILNYDQLEWTTGSNSRGDPETGLGGKPAQVGANAGDGINFYKVEGATTDSVINLTRTSNVCNPGQWIFRVDPGGNVTRSDRLSVSPLSGGMLGGYDIALTGPCLDNATSVQGMIIDSDLLFPCAVEHGGADRRTAHCIMPTVFTVGQVDVAVVINGVPWAQTGIFTVVNAGLVESHVIRQSPQDWRAGQSSVAVSWKSSLLPANTTQVLVDVVAYKNVGGQPQLDTVSSETVVATDDTTSANVLLPPLTEVTLALIRVKVPYPLINGAYKSFWSDVFPVRWSNPAQSDDWCSNWLFHEQSHQELSQEAACPCVLKQAESDTGRWQTDPLCSAQSLWQYNCVYRGSKAHQCIVSTYQGSKTVNQRCCYGNDEELLDVRDGGGGSMEERYHFRSHGDQVVPWFTYLAEDVAPFLHCCQYASNDSLCDQFSQHRAPASCQGYTPPAAAQAAGDPHIVTLDGLNYTFNGEGDFVLLQDTNGTVKVHVHASRAVDIDGNLGNATLFTAVAMAVVNETSVVEIRKVDEESVIVLIDGEQEDIASSPMELTGISIYRNETGSGTVEFTVVMDTAGVSVLVSATKDLLNIMVLVGSSDLKGNLLGLLGNYNGVKNDDLRSRQGQTLPVTSSMSDIHYLFGMTWYVDSSESLLQQPGTASLEDAGELASQSDFTPVFMDSVREEDLRNGTVELCQGNLQCIFDYQLTGKESIGQATKQFSDRFEAVIREIAPVVRCPYVQQVDNGNRTLEGQAVGQRVTFTCNKGYKLINGTTMLVCLDTGRWSGTVPDCVVDLGEESSDLLYYVGVGGGVGAVVVLVLLVLLVRCVVLRCRRKYIPKRSSEEGSEPDHFELPTLFYPSASATPVFQNPLFLSSLEKVKSADGKFQIPRPRYVDPNIYTEYF